VKDSTTDAAARELLELIDQYWDLAHAEGLEGRMTDTEAGDAQRCRHEIESRITTLTQQQGGEQEAGDVEQQARELLYAETEKAYAEPFGGPIIQHDIAVRAITAALRTKQPAPSEGDGRVPEAELLALVSGPYMYHHKMNELQEREAKGFDRCRELTMENIRIWCATRQSMFAVNTSKQAAGEAVAWEFRSLYKATGAIHCDWRKCTQEEFDRNRAGNENAELRVEYRALYTTPPRHPADEGMAVTDEVVARACVAYDTAAVGEGFMSSLDGDEHTRWMTAALTAALQAGTP